MILGPLPRWLSCLTLSPPFQPGDSAHVCVVLYFFNISHESGQFYSLLVLFYFSGEHDISKLSKRQNVYYNTRCLIRTKDYYMIILILVILPAFSALYITYVIRDIT